MMSSGAETAAERETLRPRLHASVQSVPLSVALMFKAVNASASSTLNSLFPGVENSSAAKRKGKGIEGGREGRAVAKKKKKKEKKKKRRAEKDSGRK